MNFSKEIFLSSLFILLIGVIQNLLVIQLFYQITVFTINCYFSTFHGTHISVHSFPYYLGKSFYLFMFFTGQWQYRQFRPFQKNTTNSSKPCQSNFSIINVSWWYVKTKKKALYFVKILSVLTFRNLKKWILIYLKSNLNVSLSQNYNCYTINLVYS